MHDIAEFLRGQDPFSGLDEAELDALASRTEVEFFAAGTTIVPQGEIPQGRIRVVRRGAVELLDRGRPVDLLGEGEMFGHPSVLSGLPARFEARAAEDTLCYSLVAEDVMPLLARPSSLRFLAQSLLDRGDRAVEVASRPETARQPVTALIRRPPVICSPDTRLRDAARTMVDERVGSVLVDLGDQGYGIVTDRDLRARVIVDGVSADDPVTSVMSAPVIGVAGDRTVADVMLTMLDHDIRHVPVFSPDSKILGVIAGIDLVAAETRTPFVLQRAIAEAADREELAVAARRLRSTVIALNQARLPPAQISEVISAVADALVRRMIELTVESSGPPPCEFAWMALGSHGRREPVPSSDVDSGMAWRNGDDASAYMHGVAQGVAKGIEVVGWRLDPHGVTASGAFAASSIADWRRAIATWLEKPHDERVLIAASILLDGRVIYGSEELDVKQLLFETGDRSTLLRWMLRLALAHTPPTGFRRNIVVESSGEHRGTFDIKRGGLLPVVDLARYAALRAEARAPSTVERLSAAAGAGVLSSAQVDVLREAFELFSGLRIEHQVERLEAGREPDDRVDPKQLNPLARRYLRDAFREVAAVQHALVPELDRTL